MELHEAIDKFQREVDLLGLIIEQIDSSTDEYAAAELAVSEAKRVRRDCTLLVQLLARKRDNLQPGGTR